jgi:ferritin-like metal-binding protein YciE
MDSRPEVLAESVRARRVAIDNDLELLRLQLQKADPRQIDMTGWARSAAPVIAGLAAWWVWRQRRAVDSLDQLLVHELRDLYATEEAFVPALKRMGEKATNPDLKLALEQQWLETRTHVGRLERVFRSVGSRIARGDREAVASMLRESHRLLKRRVEADVRDAWLIATAQRIGHLQIANYGTARTFAETLGYTHAAQLLQQALDEEKQADERLSRLAERFVNPQAIRASSALGN